MHFFLGALRAKIFYWLLAIIDSFYKPGDHAAYLLDLGIVIIARLHPLAASYGSKPFEGMGTGSQE